jgi:hypothetical protein
MPEPEWTDERDVAVAAVLACLEPARPDTVREVVEPHAVRAADDEAAVADPRGDTVLEARLAIVVEVQRRHHRRGACAVRDHVLERGIDARVADREDHVLDALGQALSDA